MMLSALLAVGRKEASRSDLLLYGLGFTAVGATLIGFRVQIYAFNQRAFGDHGVNYASAYIFPWVFVIGGLGCLFKAAFG